MATNPTNPSTDYYTTGMLHEIWDPRWFDAVFRQGKWCSGEGVMDPINPRWMSYHPYACNACSRGPLTNIKLSICAGCRVVKYCCRDHQKADRKVHKTWCRAFEQVRGEVGMNFGSREEWQASIPDLSSRMSRKMPRLAKHTIDIQIPVMQPRCRGCYRAGVDPDVKLVTCPRCAGVALCGDCIGDVDEARRHGHAPFHAETDRPTEECDGHLISLCCSGMIVEQGTPFGAPSRTDASEYWRPKDWREYFQQKRGDHELPEPMFRMAPVVAFVADAHSLSLTVQHILALPQVGVDAPSLTKLVVHILGSSISEESMVGKYVEMIRLNPAVKELRVVLIGPSLELTNDIYASYLDHEQIRSTCSVTVENRKGLYHEVAKDLVEEPTIVICPHSGMFDPSYTSTWRPTIEYLSGRDTPFVLTGFNHDEVVQDTALLREWGAIIIVPATPNPFRGLRPFLDPNRQPEDLIFSNASFVVAKGRAK